MITPVSPGLLSRGVSIFQGSTNTTPVEAVPLAAVLQRIQNGTYRPYVERLRTILAGGDEEAYKHAKAQSLAFTPCCAMRTRAKETPWGEKLISTTGLVYFDLDHLDDPKALKRQLAQDSHVAFAFVSPSAHGLKIGVAASGITGPEHYKHAWAVVLATLKRTYPDVHFNEDLHVKYLNALCYVSYDPLLYMNGNVITFAIPPPAPKPAARVRAIPDTLDYSRVASALASIPNHDADYDTWLLLGMALQSTRAAWARTLWNSWSRQSTKFDERKQETSWNSFNAEGSTTIASLFHLATQAGWRPSGATLRVNGTRPQTPYAVPDITQSTSTRALGDHVLPDHIRDHPDPRVRRHWERVYHRTAQLKRCLAQEGGLL